MCDGIWNELTSIDILRKRFKLTYDEARYALKMANNDLIEALSQQEREKKSSAVHMKDNMKEQGTQLLCGLKDKMKDLQQTKVSLKHHNKTLISFSAPMGIALGYLLWRQPSTRILSLTGLAYAASHHCQWEVKKDQTNEVCG